jgi:hypothetical protein
MSGGPLFIVRDVANDPELIPDGCITRTSGLV